MEGVVTKGRKLGDAAEHFSKTLLEAHGYEATFLRNNFPTYDIEAIGSVRFLVSVKAARSRQHIRLGTRASASRLGADGFVFAFMPANGSSDIQFIPGGYRLLIVPGEVAKIDSIALQLSYLKERGKDPEMPYYSLMVKGYSRRDHQREVWARWAEYEDAWYLLPPPR